MTMHDHDRNLASAFDGQAAKFERAPVQSDPKALEYLVEVADLPPDCLVLDAGCGPGLVSEVLLKAGHRVVGVDLSAEMIARAQRRCAGFGARARFLQTSLFAAEGILTEPFDAAISRYVLHHMTDPLAFVRRQAELLRPGGVLVLSDHTSDPDPELAAHHRALEWGRDHTHTHNLTPGALVDLLIRAGLGMLRLVEEPFVLDFDEWFDRGTPAESKENIRERLLAGPAARGFAPVLLPDGSVRIDCWRAIVKGLKPASATGGPG
jgi:2-polyprenyl-3-methyl-5-hydroxy-6-metoxy-1,4-benzoquinol methylase